MREKILKDLYENKNQYISGEELSRKYQVSRTAIWKHINNLKLQGYIIETMKHRGYRLIDRCKKIIPEIVRGELKTHEIGKNIIYLDTIDSTNTYGKKIAKETSHGSVVLSEEQTLGRGRLGRGWISPVGEGVFISIVLKPDIPLTEGMKMTQIAAAATCKAIRDLTGLEALIKWPNDIVVNGKKVCGILTEMAGELNRIDYLVVGIGVNTNNEKFPDKLAGIATSLRIEKGREIDRKTLIVKILENFECFYEDYIKSKELVRTLAVIRSYSAILGKNVFILKGDRKIKALALEINDDGLLGVRYENGEEEMLLSGEVSIRGEKGYI